MNDFRRSSFQFSWFIKWLFIYQAFIQLFQNFNELGHNDDSSDAETFQYDPILLYQYVFLIFHFNGGAITEILKTALGDFDQGVVLDALTECSENPITPENFEPASTYDQEGRHYHFRARAYDPFMGRFLQTDPMGYADSMNLYQAFNMNPFNFVDPMGLTTVAINIERNRINSDSVTGVYSIELSDVFNGNENAQQMAQGLSLLTRAQNIHGVTLEDLWRGNRKMVSCIPTGQYSLDETKSSIGLTLNPPQNKLLEFKDVPGNRNYTATGNKQPIRIHQANSPNVITGCIALGTSYNPSANENWINTSGPKVVELMNFIHDVKAYDKSRSETTTVISNVSANYSQMISTFKDSFMAGTNSIGMLDFIKIIAEMLYNPKEDLTNLENQLNRDLGTLIPFGTKIYVSTKDNIWLGVAPRN